MSIARRLFSLSLLVIAALVLAATPALATSVEVTDPESVHCPDLSFSGDDVSGGCEAHLVSDGEIEFGLLAFQTYLDVDACDVEATLWTDENGAVAVTDVTMSNCDTTRSNVDTIPCPDATAHSAVPNNGEIPWRSSAPAEEAAADSISIPLAICYVWVDDQTGVPVTGFDCEGGTVLTMSTGATPYSVTAVKTDLLGTSGCYVDGTWSLEGEPFTITHL